MNRLIARIWHLMRGTAQWRVLWLSREVYEQRRDLLARTRCGINFRRPDGRTYSRPDPPGTLYSRNLGIIMEAATDREARVITRRTACHARITPPPDDPGRAEYHYVTGTPPASRCPPRAQISRRASTGPRCLRCVD